MASIVPHKNGFRVFVHVNGKRESMVCRTKRECLAWGAARETELRKASSQTVSYTLRQILERYQREVAPGKRGRRWDDIRATAMLNDPRLPLEEPVGPDITPAAMARWRDLRAKEVSSGTVIREMGFLSAAFDVARREWRWINVNPMSEVRRPPQPAHREVVFGWRDIRAICRALGYTKGPVRSVSHAVAVCFLTALRTGMRAGELTGLTWDRVRLDENFIILSVTKTKARNVPLGYAAKRHIEHMAGWDQDSVFGIKPQTLDALFRKAKKRANINGPTFHDSRHTAATHLARKIDVLDLCKAFGWSNPRYAMIYYNPTATAIAGRIDARRRS